MEGRVGQPEDRRQDGRAAREDTPKGRDRARAGLSVMKASATVGDIVGPSRANEATAYSVVMASLGRIEANNGRLGAFTDVLRERAVQRAILIDAEMQQGKRYPLAGVPFGSRICSTSRASHTGRQQDQSGSEAGDRRCRGGPQARGGGRDLRRRDQYGRIRLRFHGRESERRAVSAIRTISPT